MPKGWIWTRLGYITSVVTDYVANGSFATLKQNVRTYKEKNYALFVRTVDFANNFRKDLSYIDKESYEFLEKSKLFGGELMLSNIGASIGKVFKIPHLDIPMSLAPNSIILKFFYNETSDYFEMVFKSFVGQNYLRQLTAGTAMPKFNKTELKAMIVPLPPLEEQRKIQKRGFELLKCVDNIEADKDTIVILTEQIKSKILDLAIRGQLVPQNPEDEPASVLLERIRAEKEELIQQGKIKRNKKESVIFKGEDNSYYLNDGQMTLDINDDLPFDIPDSWDWVRLKDVFIINPRNKLDDDLEVSFIPMPLIEDGYSGKHTAEVRHWKEVKTGFTHFAEGDIGVAKITPCFENRKSTVFENLTNGYGAGTTELHVLRPFGKSILAQYLLAYIKSDYFVENGKQTFTGAVGQQRIGKEYVENAYFPLPPIKEQERIVQQISAVFEYLNMISESLS